MEELKVLWNGEEIDIEKEQELLKALGREILATVFAKYKKDRVKARQTPIQKVTSDLESVKTSNYTVGQTVYDRVDEKIDAESFIAYVDDCLKILPGMYKTIIIEDYIRGRDDINVYVDLGLPRSTYYYMKNEAILELVNEFIYKSL